MIMEWGPLPAGKHDIICLESYSQYRQQYVPMPAMTEASVDSQCVAFRLYFNQQTPLWAYSNTIEEGLLVDVSVPKMLFVILSVLEFPLADTLWIVHW